MGSNDGSERLGRMMREELPTLAVDDGGLTTLGSDDFSYDGCLGEDAVTLRPSQPRVRDVPPPPPRSSEPYVHLAPPPPPASRPRPVAAAQAPASASKGARPGPPPPTRPALGRPRVDRERADERALLSAASSSAVAPRGAGSATPSDPWTVMTPLCTPARARDVRTMRTAETSGNRPPSALKSAFIGALASVTLAAFVWAISAAASSPGASGGESASNGVRPTSGVAATQ